MICDICIEGNIENKGAYCVQGITVCNDCLAKALIYYCDNFKPKPSNTKDSPESVKEARKEDNNRAWWA